MRNPELWEKIAAFEFDAALGNEPFSLKLENRRNWKPSYTARVIREYRRFLYLTQISDQPMVPATDVDTACHLHLTYTQNYWNEFCPNVLGKALHHVPSGSAEDADFHRENYEQTIEIYTREFGEPPEDIWHSVNFANKRRIRKRISGFLLATTVVFLALLLKDGDKSLLLACSCFFVLFLFWHFLMDPERKKRKGEDHQSTGDSGGGYAGCGGGGGD